MVQANVGDDAVKPGVEAALETEAVQIAVDLEKSFLVNVARIFRTLHEVQSEAENVAVEAANQFLESRTAARLRLRHQRSLVEVGQGSHRRKGDVSAARATVVIGQGKSPSGERHYSLSLRARPTYCL